MLKPILLHVENRMKKGVEVLGHNLAKLRTGRAHPSLLESITVIYYGNSTPLNQMANITVEDARTLCITPWDKSGIQAIDKAIRSSDLGLNPAVSGNVIRVPLPALTEERRKELVRHVRNEAEEARIVLRNIRRDANNDVKQLLKDKKITEDEERKGVDMIQKLTDRFTMEVDKMVAAKEIELMQV
jgi:ribosome recycling factor